MEVIDALGLAPVASFVAEHQWKSAAGFLGFITTLYSWRIREAHNLNENNWGIAQWSSLFYRKQSAGLQWINALPFLFNYVPTLIALWGMWMGGVYTWAAVFAGYVLVPIADLIVGEDSYNPTPDEEKQLTRNIWFRVVTWFYPPLYIASVLLAGYHIHLSPNLSTSEVSGIAVSIGMAGGFGIGCIHEMIHRPALFELNLARISLVFSNYGHFWLEHLFGHHKRVATDQDPASSALGDNVYTFLIRCWIGTTKSAWDIEKRFLKKRGKGVFHPDNRVLQSWIASAGVAAAFYHFWGTTALVYYLAQGVVVAAHIDNANFIEHYGLRRRVTGKLDIDGEPAYERPGWFHAWNTADRLSNWILFKIERHPDHHVNAGRPYQVLRHFKESPTMPTGYTGMFLLSWFPPLWWAVMDPLVKNAYIALDEYEAGKTKHQFPAGANNMSSAFKREGEGFFEEGSSVYTSDFYGNDLQKARDVWEDGGTNSETPGVKNLTPAKKAN